MGYIDDLRQLIGHRPIIMVGATVLVFNQNGKLMLIRRTDNKLWGIPGGAMEPGETLEETARRETYEEIGLNPGHLSLFGVFSGPEYYYRYPNGDEVYNVSAVYIADQVGGKVSLNLAEHTEMRHFNLSALPTDISPTILPIIKKYIETHPNKI